MIEIKNAPSIPGLSFRHFQGERDYAQIAAVLTASEAADHVARQVKAENIANAYKQMSNCDPFKDIIAAEVDGNMVGYARGWWENDSQAGRLYHHNGFLMPEWRRKGIGSALLGWMEEHLREMAVSDHPQSSGFFQVNASQYQTGTAAMLERTGYRPARYFYEMVRPSLADIDAFPLPEGLEIRPVEAEHYPAIWKSGMIPAKTSGDTQNQPRMIIRNGWQAHTFNPISGRLPGILPPTRSPVTC